MPIHHGTRATPKKPAPRLSGSGPGDVRRHNRALILRTIRDKPGVSRAELARLNGLSGPAVSLIVNELLNALLIREDGPALSTGGRRATTLRVAENERYILGVDVARHYIRVAITDLNATILQQTTVPPGDDPDPQVNLQGLIDLVGRVIDDAEGVKERLLGIGIVAPGPLHTSTGELLGVTNFLNWQHLRLHSAFEERFMVPVRVDNDANACALALHWLGAGRNLRDFIYFAVDSGVGAGVVLNGEVYRGAHDLAAEIGHTTIDMNGPMCPCGNIGCLEIYTTLRATLMRWRGDEQPATAADEVREVEALIAAARSGDVKALGAITETARYLSFGVINAITLFDPMVVFIGRELAAAGDMLVDPIRDAVSRRGLTPTGRAVPIELDPLGQNTPLLGAACLILCELFADSDLLSSLVRRG
ncbi:MAG: hypothetical protein JWO42_3929 [Chloroflexi bacterium]|nr:hypothetical protein [Chloroflexota bacterium]